MPAIENNKRPLVRGNPRLYMTDPGDRCFLMYEKMMTMWRAEPRWKTIDTIYEQFVQDTENNQFIEALYSQCPETGYNDLVRAAALAWTVFCHKVVYPYEDKKFKENGEI